LRLILPSELQSDKLSAKKSEKDSAGPISSEPSWTSPPWKIIKNIAVQSSPGICPFPHECVFWYLEEILDVLAAIESRDISRELQQILGALSSFLNYRVIKTACTRMHG